MPNEICPILDDFRCLRHDYAPWESSYSLQFFFFCGSLTCGVSLFCKIKLRRAFSFFSPIGLHWAYCFQAQVATSGSQFLALKCIS